VKHRAIDIIAFIIFVLCTLAIFGFWIAGVMVGGEMGHHLATAAKISIIPAFLFGVICGVID